MITISFNGPIDNDSLQIGDGIYYIMPRTGTCSVDPDDNITQTMCNAASGTWTPTVGFDHSTSTPVYGGVLMDINSVANGVSTITVNDAGTQAAVDITGDTFIMFAKDSRINLSGLIGYYAEPIIKNNSKVNAEMFSIGSEITPSSK